MRVEVMGDMTFGEKLEKYLARTGVKQAQLAREAGVSPGQITKYLRPDGGKVTRPSVPVVLRISRATRLPVEYWLDDDLDEPPGPLLSDEESKILWISREIGYTTAIRRLTVAPEVRPLDPRAGDPPPAAGGKPRGGRMRGA